MTRTRSTGDQYACEILETIKEIRAERKACTASEVSRLMRVSHTLIVRQLEVLRKAGFVDWNAMIGSVHVTPAGGKYIVAVRERGETPLADAKGAKQAVPAGLSDPADTSPALPG
jgi:DNA-binding IclR family transcriptional regulator